MPTQIYQRFLGKGTIELKDTDIDPALGIVIVDDSGFSVQVSIREGKIQIMGNNYGGPIAVEPVASNVVAITRPRGDPRA